MIRSASKFCSTYIGEFTLKTQKYIESIQKLMPFKIVLSTQDHFNIFVINLPEYLFKNVVKYYEMSKENNLQYILHTSHAVQNKQYWSLLPYCVSNTVDIFR
jgi:hypothetical protein